MTDSFWTGSQGVPISTCPAYAYLLPSNFMQHKSSPTSTHQFILSLDCMGGILYNILLHTSSLSSLCVCHLMCLHFPLLHNQSRAPRPIIKTLHYYCHIYFYSGYLGHVPVGEERQVRHHAAGPDRHQAQVWVTRVVQIATNVPDD